MPKTIEIPRRGEYKFLGFCNRKNEYLNWEEKRISLSKLKKIWTEGDFGHEVWDTNRFTYYEFKAIKPVYLKIDNLWWKIFAIDGKQKK
jgi:hypothetical protein